MSTETELLANRGAQPVLWNDEIAALYLKRLNAWHDKGKQLATQGNSTVWETADWLLEAASFNNRERWCYKEAAAILSLSVGTCRNYASTAKAFPPERRVVTSEVTFGHHRVVAALPEQEQERLLRAAVANRWPVGKLRGVVRKVHGVPRKQYLSSAEQRTKQWWMALQRLTSDEWQITQMQRLVQPSQRQPVAGCLRVMGARLIELAEQVETLPPTKDTPEEPAPELTSDVQDDGFDEALAALEQSQPEQLAEQVQEEREPEPPSPVAKAVGVISDAIDADAERKKKAEVEHRQMVEEAREIVEAGLQKVLDRPGTIEEKDDAARAGALLRNRIEEEGAACQV